MTSATVGATLVPHRDAIDPKFTWDLSAIFSDWDGWDAAYRELDQRIDAYRQYEGTLGQSGQRLLSALVEQDALGQLAYKVWYYASLQHDQDQRDNTVNARRERVQILFAKWRQAVVVVQPGIAARAGRHRARLDGRGPGARRLPVFD